MRLLKRLKSSHWISLVEWYSKTVLFVNWISSMKRTTASLCLVKCPVIWPVILTRCYRINNFLFILQSTNIQALPYKSCYPMLLLNGGRNMVMLCSNQLRQVHTSFCIILNVSRIPNSMEMLNSQNASMNLTEHWGDSITETVEAFDELQLWDRAY